MRRLSHLGLSVLLLAVSSLRINLAPSSPVGLYVLLPFGSLSRGAFVVLCPPARLADFGLARGYLRAGFCPGGSMPMLKTVAALPGDEVTTAPLGLRVNGRLLPQSKPRRLDSRGRPLEALPLACYSVLPDTLFVVGLHDESWDSRYFGPLPATCLRGVVAPLLTL